MRLLSKFLWLAAFVAATFCWMVLFEHGFSVEKFTAGMKHEISELVAKITGGGKQQDKTGN